jgi:hypothetical protein
MHKLLKTVYLSEVVSHICVFEWFKRFREGCDSFEDESSHCQLRTAKNLKTVAEGFELVAIISRGTVN